MKLYEIENISFHDMIHMQGVNLGNKITAKTRRAKIFLDLAFQTVWIEFNGKTSGIPLPSVKSYDLVEIPEHVSHEMAKSTQVLAATPPLAPEMQPTYEESDTSPEAHRARVRAASMNSNKQNPIIMNDKLIQDTRTIAMGMKVGRTAQLQNAAQVGELAAVTGKKKAISHQEMKAQVASEMKE